MNYRIKIGSVNVYYRLYMVAVLALLLNFAPVMAQQNDCKVLLESIDSLYHGPCKKGLANGNGEAWGMEHYFGAFRKGYPDGEGTFEYSDGSVFTGNFRKGMKNGFGKLKTKKDGRDTVISGKWEMDKYVGDIPEGPGYKITRSVNTDRLRVYRVGDGNRVRFKLAMSATANPQITGFMLSGDSGHEYSYSTDTGYEDVVFPFTCSVRFEKNNKLNTSRLQVNIEIVFDRPGDWMVEIN